MEYANEQYSKLSPFLVWHGSVFRQYHFLQHLSWEIRYENESAGANVRANEYVNKYRLCSFNEPVRELELSTSSIM